MPTSTAVDRVAEALGIPRYETPTGWKFFGNLMTQDVARSAAKKVSAPDRITCAKKDGLWAVLCGCRSWLLRANHVAAVVQDHWQRFGRSYYQRHDYEGLEVGPCNANAGGAASEAAHAGCGCGCWHPDRGRG